ncbi:apolipoprotein A-I-like [Labrus mixtus]|uniref:apolipoprotein A-I-like n=1 Tax=Labrus mixtus TaxID=508554 RepID=UPI0029BFDE5C|nr:apolipoprotein A-I-like [Labrus mixtus]
MKVLVVLVFAFFTGCNAELYAHKPKSKLDLMNEAFWDYVSQTILTSWVAFSDFRQTEFGVVVSDYLREGAEVADIYATRVWEQVPSHTKDNIDSLLTELANHVEEKGIAVKEKLLEPLVEEAAPVADKVASRLLQCAEELSDMASPHIENLRENLEPLAQGVQRKLTDLYNRLSKAAKSTTT